MGHGILSGCPFHLTRSWTNDMTLSYSELHRWERQSARKRKKSHKRAAASAKKKTLKSSSSTMTKKIAKAPTTSGGKSLVWNWLICKKPNLLCLLHIDK